MVRFIIVRHGYSVYNKERRFTGQHDIPLDEIGVQQAERNAAYVLAHYPVDSVYASDLCRAMDTARPVADALGLPILTKTGLREMYLGRWEGERIPDVKEREPELLAAYRLRAPHACAPGGETKAEFRVRVTTVMQEIAAECDGKTVLVATHGGVIRALSCAWMGYPIEEIDKIPNPDNTGLTVVDYDPATGHADFLLINHTEQLGDLVRYIEK